MKAEEILLQLCQAAQHARIAQDISKAELSRRSGVSTQTITKVEKGNNVGFHRVCRILGALDIKIILEDVYEYKGDFDAYYEKKFGKDLRKDKGEHCNIFASFKASDFKVDWKKSGKV